MGFIDDLMHKQLVEIRMSRDRRRIVDEGGRVTIPKWLRDQFDIRAGDRVSFHEESGKLVIEPIVMKEDLAEGYRRLAERDRELADELAGVSSEATEYLGDAPAW